MAAKDDFGDLIKEKLDQAAALITPPAGDSDRTDLMRALADAILTYGVASMVPVGVVVAWHKDLPGVPALPDNFVECNGQILSDVDSPLNGVTIPNLNGKLNTYHSKGVFLRGHSVSGVFEDDKFMAHWHRSYVGNETSTAGNNSGDSNQPLVRFSDNSVRQAVTDGVNGTPRTGTETNPANMSVVWIMRTK